MVLRGERYSSWKHTRGSAYERAGIDTGSHPTPHKREPDTNDWIFRKKRRMIRGSMKVRRVERTGDDPKFSKTDADSSLHCLMKPSRTDTVPTKNNMSSNRDRMINSISEEAEGVNGKISRCSQTDADREIVLLPEREPDPPKRVINKQKRTYPVRPLSEKRRWNQLQLAAKHCFAAVRGAMWKVAVVVGKKN
jgi:hypothetical protein